MLFRSPRFHHASPPSPHYKPEVWGNTLPAMGARKDALCLHPEGSRIARVSLRKAARPLQRGRSSRVGTWRGDLRDGVISAARCREDAGSAGLEVSPAFFFGGMASRVGEEAVDATEEVEEDAIEARCGGDEVEEALAPPTRQIGRAHV